MLFLFFDDLDANKNLHKTAFQSLGVYLQLASVNTKAVVYTNLDVAEKGKEITQSALAMFTAGIRRGLWL